MLNGLTMPTSGSAYVLGVSNAMDLDLDNRGTVDFGTPAVTDPDGIQDGVTYTAGQVFTFTTIESDVPYGRNVTVVAGGANTQVLTVTGRDYLNQLMTETFTMNGTTPVVGAKAFKTIESITSVTFAGDLDIGWGARFGLPYTVSACEGEYNDNATANAGTVVAPVTTDPATATTGDPRGLYTPTTTPNGTRHIRAEFLFKAPTEALGLLGVEHK